MSATAARRPDGTAPARGRLAPRLTGAALERARLSVVPRTRRRAARVPFVTLVSMLLLGGVVGLLLFNTSMQQASFATTALEDQSANLAARQQTLASELDDLRSPQAVAERARGLGMVLPSAPAFLDLRTGQVTGGRAASPEDGLRLEARPPRKPSVLAPPVRYIDVPAERTPEAGPSRPAGTGAGSTDEGSAGGRNGGAAGSSGAGREQADTTDADQGAAR